MLDEKAVKIFIKLVEAMRPKQTDQWKLQTEAVQAAIDELRTCFANIDMSAKSLDAKLAGERETSRRAVVQEVIHVARETEGKLSQLYQVCGLLAGSSTSDDKR